MPEVEARERASTCVHGSYAGLLRLRILFLAARTLSLYGSSAGRVLLRAGRRKRGRDERLVFVVGSPRSGTTFLGSALGSQPGLVDLGEVKPLKAAIPELARLPEVDAAARIRRTLELVRALALVRGLRPVEQTPETSFVLAAALGAYPEGRAVHIVRDGRDVVCSLLERGWLRTERTSSDDARQPFGAHARFWVEAERREEFERASEARRAAWVWRRYVTAAQAVPERTVELRYEELTHPRAAAERLAAQLDLEADSLTRSLAAAHDRSRGRWRRDLSPEQLRDVEDEAGELLRELGYSD